MFFELLPQLLRAADVARLAAFVAATQQDHDLPSVQSVINAQTGTESDAQLRHAAAHRLAIAEIPGANPDKTRIGLLAFSCREGNRTTRQTGRVRSEAPAS